MCDEGVGEGGHTGDGEISQELVGVGCTEELDEVGGREFTADDGCYVEGLDVVQGSAELEGLFVAV